MLSDWSNKGPNLWAVDSIQVQLIAGTPTYSIDPATIDILDATLSVYGNDRVMTSISRSDYVNQPNKTLTGVPTTFWFDRLISPSITMWPTPNDSYVLTLYRFRQSQDIAPGNAQTAEIPYRWIDALIWGLAERLAFIYDQSKLTPIALKAQAVYASAAAEDTEEAPMRFSPDFSGYFR